jgi:Tfp pilus assembly protein PilV
MRSRLRVRQSAGLSLLELLVTTVISTVILSVTLGLIVTQRRQYLNQQAATETGQTLQAGLEMMGNDIREAGEYAGAQTGLPILILKNGVSGQPDQITVQRKLLAQELNVCQTISAGTSISQITVSDKNDPSCGYSDGDGNKIPDDVQEWKSFRCQQDGVVGCQTTAVPVNCQLSSSRSSGRECAIAYLYDSVKGIGQFLVYAGEKQDPFNANRYQLLVRPLKADLVFSESNFTANYAKADRPRLYILDQRQYSLSDANPAGDRILQLQFTDAQNSVHYQIVNQLQDLQIQIQSDSGPKEAFNAGTPPSDPWKTVQAVEVTLTAANPAPNAAIPIQRFTSKFYPRNTVSSP